MPISADIYSQLRQPEPFNPLAELAQFEQLKGLQQQNKLGQLAFADRERASADQQRMRGIYGGGATGADLANQLRMGGFNTEATGYEKSQADQAHTTAQTGKLTADTNTGTFDLRIKKADQAIKDIAGFQNPEEAKQSLMQHVQTGDVDPVKAQAILQSMPQDPAQWPGWQVKMLRAIMSAKDNLESQKPVLGGQNLGGSFQYTARDPMTGAVTQTGSAPITQDANSMASNARMAADAQAGRSVQMRGQNMADARSRESNSAAMSKPFEVTGPEGAPVLVQQDKQGNIAPVAGYSPKTAAAGKPLAGAAVKQLTEARDNAATIDRLTTSFKPEYAGKGVLGMGADTQLSASSTLGVDKDAVEWWKNYRKQAELVERHALFGAALTPTEQSSWRSADIGPGMNKDVIKANLATREALSKKVFENTRQDLIDAGHNDKRVNAIADRGAKASSSAVDAALKKYGGG